MKSQIIKIIGIVILITAVILLSTSFSMADEASSEKNIKNALEQGDKMLGKNITLDEHLKVDNAFCVERSNFWAAGKYKVTAYMEIEDDVISGKVLKTDEKTNKTTTVDVAPIRHWRNAVMAAAMAKTDNKYYCRSQLGVGPNNYNRGVTVTQGAIWLNWNYWVKAINYSFGTTTNGKNYYITEENNPDTTKYTNSVTYGEKFKNGSLTPSVVSKVGKTVKTPAQ